jgi:anti-sigma factor RsiW
MVVEEQMTEEHVFDLLPCYALGILDEAETLLVSRHLSQCAVCRRELESYSDTPSRLAVAAPRLNPDADLKARVLNRVNGAAGQNASLPFKAPCDPAE